MHAWCVDMDMNELNHRPSPSPLLHPSLPPRPAPNPWPRVWARIGSLCNGYGLVTHLHHVDPSWVLVTMVTLLWFASYQSKQGTTSSGGQTAEQDYMCLYHSACLLPCAFHMHAVARATWRVAHANSHPCTLHLTRASFF